MKYIKALTTLTLAIFLVSATVAAQGLTPFELKATNGVAAKLTFTDNTARFEFDSVSWSPKAIFIHFFQPDCNACLAEMRELETIHQDYAGEDVLVLGIAHRGDRDEIADAGKETGVSYPLLLGTDTETAKQFARGDASIIFDSSGTQHFSQLGFEQGDVAVWRQNLDVLIGENGQQARTIERARLAVGDVLPSIRLPGLMSGDTMSLSIENGVLCFTDADGNRHYPRAAVGMFSRY